MVIFCLPRSHFSSASGKFHFFQPSYRLYSTAQMKITFWFEWNPSFVFYKPPPPPRFADKTLHVLLKWLNNVSFYAAPPTAPWRMKENHLSFLLIIFFSTASYVLNLCGEELDSLTVWNWLYFLTASWGNNTTAREDDLCSVFSYFTCSMCGSPQNAARYQRRWRFLTHPDTTALPHSHSRGGGGVMARVHGGDRFSLCVFADNSRQSSRVPVFIRLLDVNDNAPTLATVYETFVCERTKAGQVPVCLSICH